MDNTIIGKMFDLLQEVIYRTFKRINYDEMLPHEVDYYEDILDARIKYNEARSDYRRKIDVK